MAQYDYMTKVRALLDNAESLEQQAAKADDEHRPELLKASKNYQAMAEKIMREYRIEQEDILAKDPGSILPIKIDLELCRHLSPYRTQYTHMIYYIAEHVGAQVATNWVTPKDGTGSQGWHVMAYLVGYEADLRLAEYLYTAARLVFAERLEPKVDPNLSDAENVYRLRSAGLERVRVADLVWGNREKANLARVGRMYKQECARRGEPVALDGRGVTGKVYREQYANEFTWAMYRRLREARDGADSLGGAMVMHGREDRVKEAFYTHFPELRPSKDVAQYEPPAPCAKCTDEQKCRKCQAEDERYAKEEAKRMARYYSPAAQRGRLAGTAAARTVELNRTPRAQRVDAGSTTRQEIEG
jgi:hypothetical protein